MKLKTNKMTWAGIVNKGIKIHDVLFLGTRWQFVVCRDNSAWWVFADYVVPSARNF